MRTKDFLKALNSLKSSSQDLSFEDKILRIEFTDSYTILEVQTTLSSGHFKLNEAPLNNGEIFVDINLLSKIVKSCNTKDIDFLTEDGILHIKFGNSNFKLNSVEHKFLEKKIQFNELRPLNPQIVTNSLSGIASFCDPNSSFVQLKGIFAQDNICFSFAPTRIAIIKTNPFEENFFLYPNMLNFISNFKEIINFSISDEFIKIESDDFEFIFNIAKITAPNLSKFIDSVPKNRSIFNLKELSDVISSASAVNPETICLKNNNKFIISGTDNLRSDFSCIVKSDYINNFQVKLDFNKFKDAIKTFKSEEVKIDIFDSFVRIGNTEMIQILSISLD